VLVDDPGKEAPNSRWMSWNASKESRSSTNCCWPDSVSTLPSPRRNTPVNRRKASAIRPG
jgi:hypothetical protein